MKLKIQPSKAIAILEERLKELDNPSTDLDALRSRLQVDTQAIFGTGSQQGLAAITLKTTSYSDSEKETKLIPNFRQTIQGWIGSIHDYENIDQENFRVSEGEFKVKYIDLLNDWNNLVPKYNALLESKDPGKPKGWRKFFLIHDGAIKIGSGTFWVALPLICSGSFFLGTIKYDAEKIRLVEEKRALEDSLRIKNTIITSIRFNSDSALNILGHIPYHEMTLDSISYKKVQTNIENAGAALYLNKP